MAKDKQSRALLKQHFSQLATDGYKQKVNPLLAHQTPADGRAPRPHQQPFSGPLPQHGHVAMPDVPDSPFGRVSPDPTNFMGPAWKNMIVPPGLLPRFHLPSSLQRHGVEGMSGPTVDMNIGPQVLNQSVTGHAAGNPPKRATAGGRNIAEPAKARDKNKSKSPVHSGSILPRGLAPTYP